MLNTESESNELGKKMSGIDTFLRSGPGKPGHFIDLNRIMRSIRDQKLGLVELVGP